MSRTTEEEFEFTVNDIEFLATTGNQTNMIICNKEIRKLCSVINTSKNDLISALEMYYYKFVNLFMNENINYIWKTFLMN